jgi:hypothetical protein
LFKIFSLFGECMCLQWFNYSLVSTFRNETQASSTVIHTSILWLRNLPSFLFCLYKKIKLNHSLRFVCTCEHFRKSVWAELVIA